MRRRDVLFLHEEGKGGASRERKQGRGVKVVEIIFVTSGWKLWSEIAVRIP